ncbi:MAG: hypothetical protein JW712_02500 [Dehalococcoidales bacterium]|nr:hypothetical protein [Dehalococcoidales bacterium]
MIGLTCVALANARPYISPEACQLMLKTGMENTAALLEELGLTNKAIYIPSSMRDGHPQALVPLINRDNIRLERENISGRLIVRYGNDVDDMAISVATPGSINIDMLENIPGPTADEIEAAITYILTGVLDIADSASVNLDEQKIEVDVSNPKLIYEDIWYYRCMGSPVASIVAAICTEAMGKPVKISEETLNKRKIRIDLEVLG